YCPMSLYLNLVCYQIRPQPQQSTLFPYTTLFRSLVTQRVLRATRHLFTLLDELEAGVLAGHVLERLLDLLIDDAVLVVRTDVLKDRKSTRLNSSHVSISYAVFCLKKKTI